MGEKATLAQITAFGQKVYYAPQGKGISSKYVARCHICNTLVGIGRPSAYENKPILCEKCKAEIKRQAEQSEEIDRYKLVKNEIRFLDGVEYLERKYGSAYIKECEKAILIAHERKDKYDSVDEVIAAIVLIKGGYKIIPQQKIGNYYVDFVLPNEKIVIEIDGALYHKDLQREAIRDNAIILKLGAEWKIIHYETRFLRKRPKELINKVINFTQS